MFELPSLRSETRYGMPAADQIMFNRHYVIGYSYYFRQAKWALEIIDSGKIDVDRADNFRSDYRIPDMFRADLAENRGSGYDRGHLVASADQNESELQNSETFLLSNMSPQEPRFNRDIWKELEQAVRDLDAKTNDEGDKEILETYVICGPIFHFGEAIETIGSETDGGVSLPVPHSYFKSVLAENDRGKLIMWSFIIPNEFSDKPLGDFLVATVTVEIMAGLLLWERLVGPEIDKEKSNGNRPMW